MSRTRSPWLGLCLSCLGFFAAAPVAGFPIEPVGLPGEMLPGIPEGSTFNGALSPLVSLEGDVLIAGSYGMFGAAEDTGIWVRPAGSDSFRLVAKTGLPVPGDPDGTLEEFATARVRRAGESVGASFRAAPGPGAPEFGLWRAEDPDSIEEIVQIGDQAPGADPGVTFTSFAAFQTSPNGRRVANATGLSDGSRGGSWRETEGGAELVARDGDPAPGIEGLTLRSAAGIPNDSGQVAFGGGLTGPGVDPSNDGGIWLSDPERDARLLIREGDAAPGTPEGLVLRNLSLRGIDGAGGVVFFAEVWNASGGFDSAGVWGPDAEGGFRLLARIGERAPGTPEGVEFANLPGQAANDRRQTALRGVLSGPGVSGENDEGIWIADEAGNLSLTVREGDQVPDLPPGMLFSSLQDPVINERGDIAFIAGITGAETSEGLFFRSAAGELALVVQRGDEIEVRPGDLLTVTRVLFSDEQSINDRQLAFGAFLRDEGGTSRGGFLVTIPEPGTSLLVAIGLAALGAERRRSRRPDRERARAHRRR